MMQYQDDPYGAYQDQTTQDQTTTDPSMETANNPQQTPQTQQTPPPPNATPSTGPLLSGFKNFFGGMFGSSSGSGQPSAASGPQPNNQRQKTNKAEEDKRSAIEKMRDKVAEFDEDYKDIGERVLGGFTQFIGYVGPFLLMLWIGSDLGKFFTASMGTVPAYGLAYTIEGIIASCTVAMGRAFAEIAGGKANFGKTVAVSLIWLILNASSAFGLYLVITNNNQVPQGSIEQYSMVIRVVAIALGDLGCSAVLMFKGRSLQKHIESMRKRATAIGELADAQRSMEEADKNAALREQMMKSTLKIQEELSEKIGEAVSMVMTNIVSKMEKALKDDDQGKNERGYGRR
jgi:hypothetical protein